MADEYEEIRQRVTEKIGEVEKAVESLQGLRKDILQKAYETKQVILTAFIHQRDSMQTSEMTLLSRVDSLLHSKDDALVTQLSKLNQVLGCLRNCLRSEHPCGDCLEKYDDIDMDPVDNISSEFSAANDVLKQTLASYDPVIHACINTYNTVDECSLTKWLLTPTNVPAGNNATVKTTDLHTTEWLLQHHAIPSTDTGSLFTSVRGDTRDQWLRPDVSKPSSLYSYALKSFDAVKRDGVQDWLVKVEPVSAADSNSWSVCDSTSVSDTASSSCVIIPSGPASEYDGTDYISTRAIPDEQKLPTSPSLSCSVSEWIATCKSDNHSSWLSNSRERHASMTSLSDLISLQLEIGNSNEWLTPRNKTSTGSNGNKSATDTVSDRSENDQWIYQQPVERKATSDWVIGVKSKVYDQMEEKSDFSVEKEDHEWLVGETALPSVSGCLKNDDWISGEIKQQRELVATSDPRKSDMVCSNRQTDKQWLLVVNTFSKIASSDGSGWLIEQSPKMDVTAEEKVDLSKWVY